MGKPQSSIENRVAPRVKILPLHDISFTADESCRSWIGTVPVRVNNISESGVGFIASTLGESLKNGQKFSGFFHFGTQMAQQELEVVHVSPKVLGCRFLGDSKKISRLVTEYFDLEIAALRMICVKPSMLKKTNDGNPSWYNSVVDNCELYYVENQGKLVRFHFSFLGNHVDGSPHSLRYGTIVDESRDGISYKGSALVKWQENLPVGFSSMAEKFVSNVKELPEGIRVEILQALRQQVS